MTCETTLWILPATSSIFSRFLVSGFCRDLLQRICNAGQLSAHFWVVRGGRIFLLGGFACNKRCMENQLANQLQSKLAQLWLCYDIKARPFNDLASAVRHRGKPLPGFKPILQLVMDELKTLGALCLWRACGSGGMWRYMEIVYSLSQI